MDIETKKNELRGRSYTANSSLQQICNSVGMCNTHSGASLHMAIQNYIHAVVEQRVYEIVSSAEFFALTVHGAADLAEKRDGIL